MRSLFASVAVLAASAHAELPFTDGSYAAGVPTMQTVLGHVNGAEITAPDEAIRYLEKLQAAAPERMKLIQYAESWEGRPLVYAVIGGEENISRIDEIKEGLDRLASGVLSEEERDALVEELPAVTWLAYGVHGNEITSTDAGLALAYHLLAARDDATVDEILDETIVIIDPMQNPDGRARFVSSFEQARGLETQGAAYAAERDEPWPGGRFNHYLFDMNRDWFTLSQPETKGKVSAIIDWNPVAVVDAHEMGSDSTYYFAPAARPFNPQLTENTRESQEIVGRSIASKFDELGIPYFTREVYDNFYPGFGDMWPALRGAVAMTYEQASPRGLKYDRADGETLTYEDGVRNHFYATLMTAATVAGNKDRFLSVYADDRASAIEENERARDRYTVIDLRHRDSQAEAMAERLVEQGIEVMKADEGAKICGADYPEGAIVIDRAQPDGRLVRTLLDENTPLPEDFVKEQEDRRSRGLGHELYDVTAWSLPLMNDLDFTTCATLDESALDPFRKEQVIARLPEAQFGYALPWDDAEQAKLLVAALKAGIRGRTTDTGFVTGGESLPRGTVVFTHAMNGDGLRETLSKLVAEHGGDLVAMDSSWVDEGPNFGSRSFSDVRMPKVAMAWGEGTSPLSAGSTRYVLERRLGIPVTPIRVRSMGRADLSRYDVIIVPETRFSFGTVLGRGGAALKEFAEEGGVVIGLGSGVDALASDDVGLLTLRRENKVGAKETSDGDEKVVPGTELWSEEDYAAATASPGGRPDRVPGVLLRASANEDHFLSSGYDEAITLFRGSTIYAPMRANEGTNVFSYRGPDNLLASGYLWDDVRKQLGRKPFVVADRVGDGMAIGFAQDPTVRGYLDGLDLLVANAVVLAPAYTD
ncbi:M14 family metallopeptidase [Parvularcula lutaonensis]|uniref:M14 family metallopeptidase n=1 Tax=Parvularcula lutaonensis TaxID=491923 RepID=A0ABV7M8K1_9PROT|nr:M14 family metallopeptidase [Parvularcula lutaonensis]GGY42257.1 peptidase M14 [Parvularcula lutaonensis]